MIKTKFLPGTLVLIAAFLVGTFGQSEDKTAKTNKYDATLAEKLGADQYGMKSYVLVNLMTGPADAEITDKEERKKIFAGHFANMGRLAKEGNLMLAGAYIDGKPHRGLFIFDVKTLKEAVELVLTDPGVKAGIFVYEMRKLYCSAALIEVGRIHKPIQKTKIE